MSLLGFSISPHLSIYPTIHPSIYHIPLHSAQPQTSSSPVYLSLPDTNGESFGRPITQTLRRWNGGDTNYRCRERAIRDGKKRFPSMQIHSAVPPSVRRLSVSLGRRSSSLGSLFMNDCRLFLPVSLPLSCLLSYPELNASPSSSRLPTRAVAHPSIVLTGIKHNNNTTRITHSSQSSKETAS